MGNKKLSNVAQAQMPGKSREGILQKPDLFLGELQLVYYMAQPLAKHFTAMHQLAMRDSLKSFFLEHAGLARSGVKELEKIFKAIDAEPLPKKSPIVAAHLKELNETIRSTAGKDVDAIILLQGIKIGSYQTSCLHCLDLLSEQVVEKVSKSLGELIKDMQAFTESCATLLGEHLYKKQEQEDTKPVDDTKVAAVYDSINFDGKITNK